MKILLLPGLDGTGDLFEGFLKLLPGTFVTKVCPLPLEGNQNASSIATSFIANHFIDDDVIIIAESFSGLIACELIHACDDKVKGLILVSSFFGVPRPILRILRFLPLRLFPWHFVPTWALRYFCLGKDAPDELLHQVQKVIKSVPGSVIAHRVKVLSELKNPSKKIQIPCLYLQADSDRLVPQWHAEKLQSLCEDLKLEVICGPHFLLQANPEACIAPIVDFVKEIEIRNA